MKLVICLVAGFVLSLSTLTLKSDHAHSSKFPNFVRIHHH